MLFSLKTYKKEFMLSINYDSVDDNVAREILKHYSGKRIGLDMKNVKSVNSKMFISCLLKNKFKLYNLQNEVLTYLAIIMKDGFLKSYMSAEDLYNDKRELVRRHFLVA